MKSPIERILGLQQYYKSLLSVDDYVSLQTIVDTKFGKRTQEKVNALLKEAVNLGIISGLQEAENVLRTDVRVGRPQTFADESRGEKSQK